MKNVDSIRYYTTGILLEYGEFVVRNLAAHTSIQTMISVILSEFPNYQSQLRRTFDLESSKEESAINCISAAMLIGLWVEITTDKTPKYYLEHVRRGLRGEYSRSSKRAHALVSAPVAPLDQIGADTIFELWTTDDGFGRKITLGDVSPKRSPQTTLYLTFDNTATFVANRLSKLGMVRAAKERLLAKPENVTPFVNRYSLLMAHLKQTLRGKNLD